MMCLFGLLAALAAYQLVTSTPTKLGEYTSDEADMMQAVTWSGGVILVLFLSGLAYSGWALLKHRYWARRVAVALLIFVLVALAAYGSIFTVLLFDGAPPGFTAAFGATFRVVSAGVVLLAAGLAVAAFRLITRLRSEEVRGLFLREGSD